MTSQKQYVQLLPFDTKAAQKARTRPASATRPTPRQEPQAPRPAPPRGRDVISASRGLRFRVPHTASGSAFPRQRGGPFLGPVSNGRRSAPRAALAPCLSRSARAVPRVPPGTPACLSGQACKRRAMPGQRRECSPQFLGPWAAVWAAGRESRELRV